MMDMLAGCKYFLALLQRGYHFRDAPTLNWLFGVFYELHLSVRSYGHWGIAAYSAVPVFWQT